VTHDQDILGGGADALVAVRSLDIALAEPGWTFATKRRSEIDDYWKELKSRRPGIWNGQMLLGRRPRLDGDRLILRCFATDYASFIAWRDWGWPDRDVIDCFGAGVIRSSDGALLFGRMAEHTLNGGRIYPPSGGLEPRDVGADGRIDVIGSMRRELAEETGLDAGEARWGPLWAVADGCRLALAQELQFSATAAELARRVEAHMAFQQRPELTGIAVLRDGDELSAELPGFAAAIARQILPAARSSLRA
jgi:8-oxo-dGTP pyrophosphatase MutT (NUDIX family)